MENMENNSIKDNKGYIVVEQNSRNQLIILYADDRACAMTGLTNEELLATDPTRVINGLEMVPVRLDDDHELWILDTAQNRMQRISKLEQMNIALEDEIGRAHV